MARILCVCQEGNSRSVCLAYRLKNKRGHDALSMGIRRASVDTKEMLYRWADIIILVDKTFENEIPEAYRHKLKIWDVGPDIYFKGFSKTLVGLYTGFMNADPSI